MRLPHFTHYHLLCASNAACSNIGINVAIFLNAGSLAGDARRRFARSGSPAPTPSSCFLLTLAPTRTRAWRRNKSSDIKVAFRRRAYAAALSGITLRASTNLRGMAAASRLRHRRGVCFHFCTSQHHTRIRPICTRFLSLHTCCDSSHYFTSPLPSLLRISRLSSICRTITSRMARADAISFCSCRRICASRIFFKTLLLTRTGWRLRPLWAWLRTALLFACNLLQP